MSKHVLLRGVDTGWAESILNLLTLSLLCGIVETGLCPTEYRRYAVLAVPKSVRQNSMERSLIRVSRPVYRGQYHRHRPEMSIFLRWWMSESHAAKESRVQFEMMC